MIYSIFTKVPKRESASLQIVCLQSTIFLLFVIVSCVNCQDCEQPKVQAKINETDPAGTEILRVPNNGRKWNFRVQENPNLTSAFELSDSVRKGFLVFQLTRELDLEKNFQLYGTRDTVIEITFYCENLQKIVLDYTTFLLNNAINEFAPTFNQSEIVISISENQELGNGNVLLRLRDWASDKDITTQSTDIQMFSLFSLPGLDSKINGFPLLEMEPLDGEIFLREQADYESLPDGNKILRVGLNVTDNGGLFGVTELLIKVFDEDDLPPVFIHPGNPTIKTVSYEANIDPNITGVVEGIEPGPIKARDGDTLGYSITYSFMQGPKGYESYVSIDEETGEITIKKELRDSNFTQLVFLIEAREVSTARRSTNTNLLLTIMGRSGSTVINPTLSTAGSGGKEVLIVAIILAVFVFIIVVGIIIAIIYFRKRYKKAIHPTPQVPPPPGYTASNENYNSDTLQTRPTQHQLSLDGSEPLRLEEEMTTWVPVTPPKDIVDLSDEDTLNKFKKNGKPPLGTNLRDSAFEESDKKSSSDDSKLTEDMSEAGYSQIGSPLAERKAKLDQKDSNMVDSGVDETEYATPQGVGLKSPLATVYNPIFIDDVREQDEEIKYTDRREFEKSVKSQTETKRPDDSDVSSAKNSSFNVNKSNDESSSGSSSTSETSSENYEDTEYCSPRPEVEIRRPTLPGSDLLLQQQKSKQNPEELQHRLNISPQIQRHMSDASRKRLSTFEPITEEAPAVPPRPNTFGVNSLSNPNLRVKQSRTLPQFSPKPPPKDKTESDSRYMDSTETLQAPIRRKRPKRRSKNIKSPKEDVYDGTIDDEDFEVDPSFYTNGSKARVKRSNRLPVMKPDPNDTRYWVTVTNDAL